MSVRSERVADEVRDVVAKAFTGDEMRDPRVQAVTITSVKISSDLQVATVYFRLLNDETAVEDVMNALERASGI